ncbi:hypothetical protein VYU27_008770, partial [Nannochloropsis oceanica]
MPRLDALGVTPQVRAALGSDVETAEELFMMAPGGRGGGGGMRGTGLGKQELQLLQVAVAEKTGPDTYLHASLSSSSICSTEAIQSEGKEEGGGRKRRAVLPGLDCACAHWKHQLEGVGEGGAMSTGIKSLDQLLSDSGGGVPLSQVTELVGPSPSGKTQLCLTLAAEVALTLSASVLYLDTNGCFCPRRLRQIVGEKYQRQQRQLQEASSSSSLPSPLPPDLPPPPPSLLDACLSRVSVLRVSNEKGLFAALDSLDQHLSCGHPLHRNLRLLVLDSLRALLAPLLGQTMPNGHYLLGAVGKMLNYLALRYGLAVVVTNGVVLEHSSPSSIPTLWGRRPALGAYWSLFPSLRLMLRLGGGGGRGGGREGGGDEAEEDFVLGEVAVYSAT